MSQPPYFHLFFNCFSLILYNVFFVLFFFLRFRLPDNFYLLVTRCASAPLAFSLSFSSSFITYFYLAFSLSFFLSISLVLSAVNSFHQHFLLSIFLHLLVNSSVTSKVNSSITIFVLSVISLLSCSFHWITTAVQTLNCLPAVHPAFPHLLYQFYNNKNKFSIKYIGIYKV